LGAAWLLACTSSGAPSQSIPDEPSCGECRIRTEVVVKFGSAVDEGMLGSDLVKVYSLRDGWFGLSDSSDRGFVRLFDPSGRFQRRIGAYGQGPGEYQGLSDMFRTEDGYLLFDVTLGRLSWVDEDFVYQRSIPLGFSARRVALLPDGERLLVNALVSDGLAEGHVLSVVAIGDTPRKMFGGSGKPLDLRRNRLQHQRQISNAVAGSFWAGELGHYRLKKYSLAGEELAALDRSGEIFPGSDSPHTPRDPSEPPPTPSLRALYLDSEGLLWVAFTVADEDWQEAVRDRAPDEIPDRNKMSDTAIEVIDPTSGRLLARTMVPWHLFEVPMMEASGHMMMSHVAEEENGFLGATVLRFTLER
jgi:hypothetical protein